MRSQRSICARARLSGDRWHDVLGLCYRCSFKLLNISDLSRRKPLVMVVLTASLSARSVGIFPSLRHVHGSDPTVCFEVGCRPFTHSSLGFPFHAALFFSMLFGSVRMVACVVRLLTRLLVRLSPPGAIQRGAWVTAHSEHRFPAPSSKLCQIYLRH